MNDREEFKIPIKVVMNKEKTKVLFVEAGRDFVDVLMSLLHLPLGKIIEVLQKNYGYQAPIIGSMSTLYDGIANLEIDHFDSELAKHKILHPLSSSYDNESCQLRLDVNAPRFVGPQSYQPYNGANTEGGASFIITDDLRVMQNVSQSHSCLQIIDILGFSSAEMTDTVQKNVTFGFAELLFLLSRSLVFENPLTVLYCGSQMGLAPKRFGLEDDVFIDEQSLLDNPVEWTLKVVKQKSTEKVLFALSDSVFINFLCEMLTIPLGTFESYLDSRGGFKAVDNLHISNRLKMIPTPRSLLTQTMDISGFSTSKLYSYLSFCEDSEQEYVKGTRLYMVRDNLTVTPLDLSSGLSIFHSNKIAAHDVEELEVKVGLLNGLRIMKAALTSTTALTDSLIKPILEDA